MASAATAAAASASVRRVRAAAVYRGAALALLGCAWARTASASSARLSSSVAFAAPAVFAVASSVAPAAAPAAEAGAASLPGGASCWLVAPEGCRADPDWARLTQESGAQAADEEAVEEYRDDGVLSEEACRHIAHARWISCGNAALEPILFTSGPPVSQGEWLGGSYPPYEIQRRLHDLRASPLDVLFEYEVTFFWATNELTQYSDIDFSRPECGSEWQALRAKVFSLAHAPKETVCGLCESAPVEIWEEVDRVDHAEFPLGGPKNDCLLGVFSAIAAECMCHFRCGPASRLNDVMVSAADMDVLLAVWRRLQLELEAVLFFFTMPLVTLASSSWPLPTLLRHIGEALNRSFGEAVPNECDLLDLPRASNLRRRALAIAAAERPEDTDEDNRLLVANALQHVEQNYYGCPFGHSTAFLTVMRASRLFENIALTPGMSARFGFQALDSLKAWDVLHADRVGKKRRFFYDVLTTRWPWLQMLQRFEAPPPPLEALPPRSCAERLSPIADEWLEHEARSPFNRAGRAPLRPSAARAAAGGGAEGLTREALVSALCALDGAEVLFISGTSSGYQWGSFTVRGRQAARGLRQLRERGPELRARAFNRDCSKWCEDRERFRPWPRIVVHIKYPCRCLMDAMSVEGAIHVYDPVDQFAFVPPGMHALLAQTTLAARDYDSHPSVQAEGVRVFWHPLHHSNFDNATADWREPVERIGAHTTHNDTELFAAVEAALADSALPEEAKAFRHIDPAARFFNTGGHVVTPQQTEDVYRQMTDLDITVVRNSGCMMHLNCEVSRKWFCDRYKTGQRLVNAFAVGIPAVLFNERGFLDVVEGSGYPAVARSAAEAATWVRRLAVEPELRLELRSMAFELAAPFALPLLSERLALIFAELLADASSFGA